MPTTKEPQATYHCEKCGKTVKASERKTPMCCGVAMKKTTA